MHKEITPSTTPKAPSLVGKYIIATKLGIGQVEQIVNLFENDMQFLKVKFPHTNAVDYFPVKNSRKYRIVSSKEEILRSIDTFKGKHEPTEFSSIQEKIKYYDSALSSMDIQVLAQNLSILNREKELHSQIKKYYENALDSYLEEILFVLDLEKSEVKKLLDMAK